MNKLWSVCWNEYLNAILSKAFLVGVIMSPLMMFGVLLVQKLTSKQVDIRERSLQIVDETGRYAPLLKAAADLRNETQIFSNPEDNAEKKQIQPKFAVSDRQISEWDNAQSAEIDLSSQVSDEKLFAYVWIKPGEKVAVDPLSVSIEYHSNNPSYEALPEWIGQVITAENLRVRMQKHNLSPEVLQELMQTERVRRLGLVEVGAKGEVSKAKESSRIVTFAIPFGSMMLMFMLVMSTAPVLLNNVLEEKMQKISEFLVSSVSPFQLMMGKLLGALLVAMTLSVVYVGASIFVMHQYGVLDLVPKKLFFWFFFFEILALSIYGSIFGAIGAACSELRDAQSLMTPAMLIVMIPMVCFAPVINSPSSPFAVAISLIPPVTPMLMLLRIAIPPGPAGWEIALGTVLCALFAVFCVWAGSKVFRIGILSQGETPTLAKLVRWVFSKG